MRHRVSASGERGSRSIQSALFFRLEDYVRNFRHEKFLDSEAHAIAGAWEAGYELGPDGPCDSPAEEKAAAPISSYESIRKISPNPSSFFSIIRSTTSYVVSRAAMPVPPVVMMASTPESASRSTSVVRMLEGSSLTMERRP